MNFILIDWLALSVITEICTLYLRAAT